MRNPNFILLSAVKFMGLCFMPYLLGKDYFIAASVMLVLISILTYESIKIIFGLRKELTKIK